MWLVVVQAWGLLHSMHAACCPPAHPTLLPPLPQPYEDVLPYSDFSLRLPASDIPRIGDVLRGVSETEYLRLRGALPRYWPAFVWDPAQGGQAYNYTLRALHRRMRAMHQGHF